MEEDRMVLFLPRVDFPSYLACYRRAPTRARALSLFVSL